MEGDVDTVYGIQWDRTSVNSSDTKPCPIINGKATVGTAFRRCLQRNIWDTFVNVSNCRTPAFANLRQRAVSITLQLLMWIRSVVYACDYYSVSTMLKWPMYCLWLKGLANTWCMHRVDNWHHYAPYPNTKTTLLLNSYSVYRKWTFSWCLRFCQQIFWILPCFCSLASWLPWQHPVTSACYLWTWTTLITWWIISSGDCQWIHLKQ